MQLLDGKKLSRIIKDEVKEEVERLKERGAPKLTLVQVGDDPASSVYVKNKIRSCEECGITSQYIHLSHDVEEEKLRSLLDELSQDPAVNGILLQLPLPGHLDEDKAISMINPEKDVDGFHPENLGLLVAGGPRFIPCTPMGIMEMFKRYEIRVEGKNVVIIGRSLIVGKPLALLLSMKSDYSNATVTICHSRTPDISMYSRRADILVAAIGRPRHINSDMLREGVVVVDVGINRVSDPSRKSGYRLVGDVDFEDVSRKASYITPVPGGVGPMTVAMLMFNTLRAFKLQFNVTNVS